MEIIGYAPEPAPHGDADLKLADSLTQALSIVLMLTATEQDLQLLREMADQGIGVSSWGKVDHFRV